MKFVNVVGPEIKLFLIKCLLFFACKIFLANYLDFFLMGPLNLALDIVAYHCLHLSIRNLDYHVSSW